MKLAMSPETSPAYFMGRPMKFRVDEVTENGETKWIASGTDRKDAAMQAGLKLADMNAEVIRTKEVATRTRRDVAAGIAVAILQGREDIEP